MDDALHHDPLPADGAHRPEVLRIDCGECLLEHTDACADCVVTWLVEREPGDVVVVDLAEVRALRALQHGGLVPELRHRQRPGSRRHA